MLDPASIISISELNHLARLSLEREFPLLWVAGEISNLTRAASGHVYFSLKDEGAQARCVMFRSRAASIPWRLENGQQVEARVLVSLYEPRGDFQLNVESLRRAGRGRLFEIFAQLKQRLEAEGLFAPDRKRPVPRFPNRIGIVSSPQAAALRDVLATLRRRAPHLSAILYPTQVQGEAAAEEIAKAIAVAGQRGECAVLLLVRGGGSIEDLWAFNEEVVARAMASCPVPIISGVGHETDTTMADYVADLRAATPTAAAELATQGWHDASDEIADLGVGLSRAIQSHVTRYQQMLDRISLRLVHPATRLEHAGSRLALLGSRLNSALGLCLRQRRDHVARAAVGLTRAAPRIASHRGQVSLLAQRLGAAGREHLRSTRGQLDAFSAALAHLNPEATLARGYSIVRDAQGHLVSDAARLTPGQVVNLRLPRGSAEARIVSSAPGEPPIAT